MTPDRRRLLATIPAVLAAGLLAGCAGAPVPAGERIVDGATGQTLAAEALHHRVRAADILLLGEVHDDPAQHAARGRLLRDLGRPAVVVAEHLPAGAELRLPWPAGDDALLAALQVAGFDDRGWQWPAHRALFAGIAEAGLPLRGGNLPRDAARAAARDGETALPPDLRDAIAAAPLAPAGRDALQQDLLGSHCGQLPASRLPGMVAAQRGRDAAMAAALVQARAARPGALAVLVAGNGHVGRDHGVPVLLAAIAPQARLLVVGSLQEGEALPAGRYDVALVTPAISRPDPCAGWPAAPAPSASAPPAR